MLHTVYAANGKVSHIHQSMCEWDYTIDKAKKGGHVRIKYNSSLLDSSHQMYPFLSGHISDEPKNTGHPS
jgi:hypothetical protein